ncbi:MAG: hypothetical protein V5A20_13055, partial [Salinibacter sp.]|uniref:hypothetical protein n=1 Tax=Salinibacter sp. TaxID=2065818 RepID=UPI002FC2E408
MFASRHSIQLVAFFLVGLLLSTVGQASADPCAIELQKPGSSVTIDGVQGSGEWSQAGQISSSDGCLDQVQELNTSRTYDITVYSQRYDQGGTEYLGFLFVVPDATTQDSKNPADSTTEQIYVYFDPNRSGGTALATGSAGSRGTDYRLKLQHGWKSQTGGGLQSSLEWATPSASATCSQNLFKPATLPSNATEAVSKRSPGAGYVAEVRIPVSAIGNPGSGAADPDIGVAFAVVDDQGTYQASSVVTDKFAASFPAVLPSNNANNPATPCPAEYHKPENYGVGLWTSTTGDVTISRQPVFWNSQDIRALQCGEMSTYTYYSDAPCELTLEATIHNSRPADLVRHVLYVWADHGASPSTWRFVDLQQSTVPAGGSQTITSAVWGQVPSGLAHHPCVRAYILPQNLNQGGWSASRVRNISSSSDLTDMMSAYGLNTANWAQKNISASSGTNECPNEGCRIEAGGDSGDIGAPGVGWEIEGILAGLLLILVLGVAVMEIRRIPWRRTRRALPLVLVLGVVAACTPSASDLLLSDSEFNQFHSDNAIVQMQVYGVVPVENPDPETSNFYDVIGGVHRLIPESQLAERGRDGIPLELRVTNTNTEPQRVLLSVESVLPPALQE